MTALRLAEAVGAIVVVAAVMGLAPQRMLQALREDAAVWRPGLWLTLAAAVAGLTLFAGAQAILPRDVALGLGLLAAILTAMAIVDAGHMLIPDIHVLGVAVLGLVGPLAPPLPQAALGAVLGGGLLWGVRHFYRRTRGLEGLGLGDVKLAAALGAVAGPRDILWIVIAAAVLGLLYGLARGGGRTAAVPFGTAMALPALVTAGLARWPS